jgi:flagellar protein FlgJ
MTTPPAFDPWAAALGVKTSAVESKASAKQAAQQFEALLIRQFLANSRSTSWLNDQQESESGWREIADDSLAGYLVKSGGLGLSKQVESLIHQAERSRSNQIDSNQVTSARVKPTGQSLNALNISSVNANGARLNGLAASFFETK